MTMITYAAYKFAGAASTIGVLAYFGTRYTMMDPGDRGISMQETVQVKLDIS